VRRDPLERLSIRAALVLGFGLVLSLWASTGYVLSVRIAETERQTADITRRYMYAQDVLSAVRQHVNLSSILLRDALLNPGDETRARYRRRLEEGYAAIASQLDGYTPVSDDDGDQQLARLRSEVSGYRLVTLKVLDEAQAMPSTPPSRLLDAYVVPRRTAAIALSDEIRALNRRALLDHQAATASVHRTAEQQWWYSLGAALAATLGIALVAIVYAGRLEDRLRQRRANDQWHAIELQQLSARLVQAQEEERRSIARELHDEVGQVLSAIGVEAQLAERAIEKREDASRALGEVQQLADHALHTVRDLSQLLRPTMLDDLGLAAAVDWLLRGLERRHAVQVDIVQRGMVARLPAEVEVAAFRIIQEAVTNVARHARATRCTVRLTTEGPRLFVEIEDDGIGFDPGLLASAGGRRGLGLLGMRERAAALGGIFAVDSMLRQGTRVRVTLPLREDTEAETRVPAAAGIDLAHA
jgi:signal transduction histidine kinase